MSHPFGEAAILDDGRLVVAPWSSPGVWVGDQFLDGPVLRMPDATIDDQGRVWVVAHAQSTTAVWVRLQTAPTWWQVCANTSGTRTIIRPDGDGCVVACTTTPTSYTSYAVRPDGQIVVVETGTIPSGEGGHGMASWNADGTAHPLAPLDQTIAGHRIRSAISGKGTTIACALFDPAQVVMVRGDVMGTLTLGGIDWPTPRLSTNGQWWVGVQYTTQALRSGRLPETMPSLQVAETAVAPWPRRFRAGVFFRARGGQTDTSVPVDCEVSANGWGDSGHGPVIAATLPDATAAGARLLALYEDSAGATWDLERLREKHAAFPSLPIVLNYDGDAATATWPSLPGMTTVKSIEAYPLSRAETATATIARVEAKARAILATEAALVIVRCVYLQQGNPHWTLEQVLALQPAHNAMLARLLRAFPHASLTSLSFAWMRDIYGASAIPALAQWVRAELQAMPPGPLSPLAGPPQELPMPNPTVTIVDWSPKTVKPGELVRAVAQITGAGAHTLTWYLDGHPVVTNPATDLDHHFMTLAPGTHRIAVEVQPGGDRTGKIREFTVTATTAPPPPPPDPPAPPPSAPPPPPAGRPTLPDYQTFVFTEGPAIDAAFEAQHGGGHPGPATVRHFSWRRLWEGWPQTAILQDIATEAGYAFPGPPPGIPGRPGYDEFIGVEGPEVDAAYEAVTHSPIHAADVRHNAYRRLVEGWTRAAVLAGIRNDPTAGPTLPDAREAPPAPAHPPSSVSPLTTDGVNFMVEGRIHKIHGVTGFTALQDWLVGRRTHLDRFATWAQGAGMNSVRVFGMWKVTHFDPRDYGQRYYDSLHDLAAWLGTYGLRLHYVAFCDQIDGSDVKMSSGEQDAHARKTWEIVRAHHGLYELVNEDWKNGKVAHRFTVPPDVVATRSAWLDGTPNGPTSMGSLLRFTTEHTPRDGQWMRKAKNLLETARTASFRTGVPAIAGEPIGLYEETQSGRRTNDAEACFEYYALADLYGAGAVVHGDMTSMMSCVPPGPKAQRCVDAIVRAWQVGIPLTAAGQGHYTAGGKTDCPMEHADRYKDGKEINKAGALRTYLMTQGRKATAVVIQPGEAHVNRPKSGWRIVKTVGTHDQVVFLEQT